MVVINQETFMKGKFYKFDKSWPKFKVMLYNINAFIKLLLARYGQKLFNVGIS